MVKDLLNKDLLNALHTTLSVYIIFMQFCDT